MDGMQREDDGHHKAHSSVAENPFSHQENQANHAGIQDHVGQMESVGQGSKELVTEKVPKSHQRPVVICHALRADVGPDIAGKDFPQVGKAAQVGVGQDLTVVVLYKAVQQRAKVGQDGNEDKNREQFVGRESDESDMGCYPGDLLRFNLFPAAAIRVHGCPSTRPGGFVAFPAPVNPIRANPSAHAAGMGMGSAKLPMRLKSQLASRKLAGASNKPATTSTR